jgi:hypothetical protein
MKKRKGTTVKNHFTAACERVVSVDSEIQRTKKQLDETVAEREACEAAASRAVAEGDHGGLDSAADRISRLQSRERILHAAVAELESRRERLIAEIKSAAAADRREAARKPRAEFEKIRDSTLPLLKKLGELEGIVYTRRILHSEAVDNGSIGVARSWLDGAPLDELSFAELNLLGPVDFVQPRSRAFLDEAMELERQAAQLETNPAESGSALFVQYLESTAASKK